MNRRNSRNGEPSTPEKSRMASGVTKLAATAEIIQIPRERRNEVRKTSFTPNTVPIENKMIFGVTYRLQMINVGFLSSSLVCATSGVSPNHRRIASYV